jgi:hypothetical protein
MIKQLSLITVIAFLGCQNSKNDNAKLSKINPFDITKNETLPEVQSVNFKSIEDVTFKIQKISSEGIKKLLQARFTENVSDYKNFTCFYFDIQCQDNIDIVKYSSENFRTLNERIQYLSFMIKDDITIRANNKVYRCINSTYDRTYGQIPYARFFLVFEKIEDGDLLFQYNDYYFNKGLINLKIQ